ncbi:hypothetical protein HYALB_00004601 [Hymenoscyphus albidus]|uniref:Sodium/calcium exchanger membrane region domain-containing protein n=1 Tax=Hymenoscyphus albidus TaxID=595503 RepID=A0A9N9QDI7_9HELO|nr:hypothetical protein HYALB_00004601 [Hymenoscyphus albidus]
MADYGNIFFNVAAFMAGLFVLEFGADRFVDHTAKVATRLKAPSTLIALLTAGAEWEELIVIIASVSQSQSSLAMGNIVGSSISNILGAFSLGLVFSPNPIVFDRSSKIYCTILLVLTSLFILLANFLEQFGKAIGVGLVAAFGVYVGSVGWAIYKGIVTPPENDSDSDSDSDSEEDADILVGGEYKRVAESENHEKKIFESSNAGSQSRSSSSTQGALETGHDEDEDSIPLTELLFDEAETEDARHVKSKPKHSTIYHIAHLLLGLAALSLSGYLLSHTLTTLATEFHLSTNFLGITILSIATTLPEKMIAVFSGSRQQGGIMVANSVGSNIFLVTLCAGVLFLAGDLDLLKGGIQGWELGVIWGCAVGLFAIVMIGGRRWMGWVMLVFYAGFLAVEILTEGNDKENNS